MRAGSSKAKGSQWEREVGKTFSLWLTNNERPDLFSRNVLSGGAFTIAHNKGDIDAPKVEAELTSAIRAGDRAARAEVNDYLRMAVRERWDEIEDALAPTMRKYGPPQ